MGCYNKPSKTRIIYSSWELGRHRSWSCAFDYSNQATTPAIHLLWECLLAQLLLSYVKMNGIAIVVHQGKINSWIISNE